MCQQSLRGRLASLLAQIGFAALSLALPWSSAIADDRPLPACSLNLGAGNGFDQFKGKVLYIDFWASWCVPCLLSFPFMNDLQKVYGSHGLQVVAVNVDEKPSDATAFLAKHPPGFLVAPGPNGPCAQAFGVASMPTSFLVDRKGAIRATHSGFRAGDADGLRAAVEALVAEKTAQ